MKVVDAKQLAVDLILHDLQGSPLVITLDGSSPDGDAGKFMLDGRAARAIHHFDGWYVPINLAWFDGSFEPPEIHGKPFHWYVFAIPRRGALAREHYFLSDFLQIRDWVLDFSAPLGRAIEIIATGAPTFEYSVTTPRSELATSDGVMNLWAPSPTRVACSS